MHPLFELTTDNYYSREADERYMSCSQYRGWLECEAKQKAILDGRWEDEDSKALIVGKYFHAYFEGQGAFDSFCEENFADIFKTRSSTDKKTGLTTVTATGKYADFVQADSMIRVAERDELIKSLIDMPGESEKIMTGELFGIPWRIRVDKYVPDGRWIIDWKTTKNIWETTYNPALKERETFVETYGYMMRAAVYSEIEKQSANAETDPHFLIVAISKQDPPDKEALLLNHRQRYDWELEQIKGRIGNILMVKNGSYKPKRCGFCGYCRATKKLFAIKPYYKLAPEFREGREEDYEPIAGPGPVLDGPQEA